jgi:hypothetical protein
MNDTTQPAVAGPVEPTVRPAADPVRSAFEAWVTDGGKWPQAALRTVGGAYSLMVARTQWTAWKAGSEAERARLLDELKIAMEHSAWDGVLQLDDALRNISDLRA